MRMKDLENLFGYERRGIASGEEGIDEVCSVVSEVIMIPEDSLTPVGQIEGD